MAPLINRLKELLASHFPGATADLETVAPINKVGGFLKWDGFEAVEQIDRQRRLRAVIREELSRQEQSQLTTILTVTPAEVQVMREQV
jgi:hypothetical protein